MNQPDITTLDTLLDTALNVPLAERLQALQSLVEEVALHDPFTISAFAEKAKSHGLCNKTDFKGMVGEAQKALLDSEVGNIQPTDDDLAGRWKNKHPNTAYGLGEFRRYKDGIWQFVDLDAIKGEFLDTLGKAKFEGVRPSKARLESVLELARIEVSVPNDKWDTKTEYLPLRNGVLHIPTRELVRHDPNFYFSSGIDFDYNPEAKCPNFMNLLATTVPEAESFLQEFAGYSLTTDTSHEIAVWLHGPPGSGKSTFLGGIQSMLGSRAGLLGLADIERSRFALTNLPGKTLVVCSDLSSSHITATHLLNSIISGETVTVDRKYREPVDVTPFAKVIWAMNELPEVNSANNGLLRRVKVVSYPPLREERDRTLKNAVKAEGPGILNWALDGGDRLMERGYFDPPQAVLDATTDFKEKIDVPAKFVAECCVKGSENKTQASILYNAYKQWCYDTGHQSESMTAIAEEWKRLGFTRNEARGLRFWWGVGLGID